MTCLSCQTSAAPHDLANGMCLKCNAIRYDRLKSALLHLVDNWQRGGDVIEDRFHDVDPEGGKNARSVFILFATRLQEVVTVIDTQPPIPYGTPS